MSNKVSLGINTIILIIFGAIITIVIGRFDAETVSLSASLILALCMITFLLVYGAIIWRMYGRGKLDINTLICLIFIFGWIMKMVYVKYTSILIRSDDVYYIDGTGHMGYIYSLFENHRFPGNPADGWEYGQPPLHHLVSAVWMTIVRGVGASLDGAIERVQYLTTFYSTAIAIVADFIYREFSDDNEGRIYTALATTFFPYMFVLSGDCNNDALLSLMMILTILFTVRWAKDNSLKNIVLIAIFFGLSMMTKYSAALLVPPIAMVFAIYFFANKKYIQYIKQFAVFLIISVPLSFWWPVYLLKTYGTPFGFVQESSPTEPQYIGGYSVMDRLFSIQNKFNHSYVVWDNKAPECDYNIFINMIKMGCFGEQDFICYNKVLNTIGDILFWLMLILTVVTVVLFVKWVVDSNYNLLLRLFVGISAIIVGLSAVIRTCTERMAYICNSNIRFVIVAVILFYIMSGLEINRTQKRFVRAIQIVMTAICILSCTMWMLCVMYH